MKLSRFMTHMGTLAVLVLLGILAGAAAKADTVKNCEAAVLALSDVVQDVAGGTIPVVDVQAALAKTATCVKDLEGLAPLAAVKPTESCESRCKHHCPWYEVSQCVDHCLSGRPPTCTVPPSDIRGWHWPTCHDSWPDCVPPALMSPEHKSCEDRCEHCTKTTGQETACVAHCLLHNKPKCG